MAITFTRGWRRWLGSRRWRGAVVVAVAAAAGVAGVPAAGGALAAPGAAAGAVRAAGCAGVPVVPLRAGAGSSLAGVAALSGCDGWAVGSLATGVGSQALVEHWDGRRWAQVRVPDPGAGVSPGSRLSAVAAVSAGDVWAVGWYAPGEHGTFALAEHWDGSAWRQAAVPAGGSAATPGSARLLGVAADRAGGAWAVGESWPALAGPGGAVALAERWDGRGWQVVRLPVPAGSARSELDGVASSGPGDAWAVGSYVAGGARRALAEHWDGTSWKVVPVPDPAGKGGVSGLAAVAAAPGGGAWAAGSYARPGGLARPLALRWHGRSWAVVPAAVPAGRGVGAGLDAVAAVRGGVWAVGSSLRAGVSRSLAERWDGRSWKVVPVPGRGGLAGVAPDGQVGAWAVGAGAAGPLAERWVAGSWRQVPAGGGAPPSAPGEAQASALAARLGVPVAVSGEQTSWTRVFAVPQGGFEARVSLVPRQVRRGGSWVPVDTRLSVRGGAVRPAATLAGLRLSDGGGGPLYTITWGADSLSVAWPFGPLPVPVLSGPTAEYDGVFPGVNLLVTATPTGMQELLEVTSPAAAAAIGSLTSVTFPVTAAGVSLSADGSGNLTATDSSGNVVFAAATPRMWDSSATGRVAGPGPDPQAPPENSPEPGDQQAAIPVSVAPGSLTLDLTGAAALLASPSVTYPVFIDPNWDVTKDTTGTTWSDVEHHYTSTSDNSPVPYADWMPTSSAGAIRSGVACDYDNSDGTCQSGSPYEIYRSFLNFPVPPDMHGAPFADGQLEIDETWAWSCSATNSNVSSVTVFGTDDAVPNNKVTYSSTTWDSQPAAGTWQGSDSNGFGWLECPDQYVFLPAKHAAVLAAGNNWANLTLRLSATSGDESGFNQYSWKKFTADSMTLDLYWRNPPDLPWNYGTVGAFDPTDGTTYNYNCSNSQANPDWVNSNHTEWRARISDGDGVNGGNLNGLFDWTNTTPNPVVSGTLDADANAGGGLTSGSVFTASRSGSDGDVYKWQAYGETLDGTIDPAGNPVDVQIGPKTSPACYTGIDTDAPDGATAVSPISVTGVSVGAATPFTYTYTAGSGNSDVVGFYYGIDDPRPSQYVQASETTTTSTASVTVTPFSTGEEDLYVQAVDRAGNRGQVTGPYPIQANATSNTATLGWWMLNGNGNDSVTQTATSGTVMTAYGPSYGCPGNATAPPAGYVNGCSLALAGSGYAATSVPVLGNDASFTVSAWVYPSSSCGSSPCTVLSQDGASVSGFTLAYQKSGSAGGTSCPCWLLSMPQSDSPSPSWYTAVAAAPSATGKWTQLTGVLDAAKGTLTLYVNGTQAATAAASPWSAPAAGPFRIGADWTSVGGPGDFLTGSVSDACAFYGALQPSDVTSLYDGGSGDGCAVLYGRYP